MYSSCSPFVFKQLFRNERILSKLLFTFSKVSVEIDDKISDRITNQEIKMRKHPGVARINCVNLPQHIRNAILSVSDVVSKSQLLKESESFTRYLHSRQPPIENSTLKSKALSVKLEVEDSLNVNEEFISEEEREHYKKLVQHNVNYILKQRTYNWQPIFYTRHKGLQYLFSRAASEYAVLMQVFNEIKIRDDVKPETLFDFGSGVGTVLWAACETWGTSFKEFFCVDSSNEMNCLSEEIINLSYKNKLKDNLFYRQFLPASSNPNYDIVVSAYSLMELPSASSRSETLSKLWNKTSKYLVLIEQGTLHGFKIISEARDFILQANQKDGTDLEKAHIFSPCPHELICPRISEGGDHLCNFQVSHFTFPKKEQTREELYCYVVINKGPRKSDDASWPRIVKPVLCKSRHIICRMCTSNGSLQEIIVTPKKHGRIPYSCAKRTQWGDRLPFTIKNTTTDNTDTEPVSED